MFTLWTVAPAASGPKRVVLVVEDDPPLRTFYQSALTLAGYAVVTAADGIDALARIEGHQPAAVVLDLGLPRLSGGDIGRELAASGQSIPLIVVTGSEPDGLNPADYACILRKPVSAEALIQAVETCIGRAGA